MKLIEGRMPQPAGLDLQVRSSELLLPITIGHVCPWGLVMTNTSSDFRQLGQWPPRGRVFPLGVVKTWKTQERGNQSQSSLTNDNCLFPMRREKGLDFSSWCSTLTLNFETLPESPKITKPWFPHLKTGDMNLAGEIKWIKMSVKTGKHDEKVDLFSLHSCS